jgi:hypothetical protein
MNSSPEKYTEKVNSILTRAIEEFYADHPIYTLKTTDVKQAAARIVLKDVMIGNKEFLSF